MLPSKYPKFYPCPQSQFHRFPPLSNNSHNLLNSTLHLSNNQINLINTCNKVISKTPPPCSINRMVLNLQPGLAQSNNSPNFLKKSHPRLQLIQQKHGLMKPLWNHPNLWNLTVLLNNCIINCHPCPTTHISPIFHHSPQSSKQNGPANIATQLCNRPNFPNLASSL